MINLERNFSPSDYYNVIFSFVNNNKTLFLGISGTLNMNGVPEVKNAFLFLDHNEIFRQLNFQKNNSKILCPYLDSLTKNQNRILNTNKSLIQSNERKDKASLFTHNQSGSENNINKRFLNHVQTW